MKSIFVPIGGGDSDAAVLETALAVATPLQAHLEFLHVHVDPADAARYTPHVEFARGPAIHNALAELTREQATRAMAAGRHVQDFCARSGVAMRDHPDRTHGVTARWNEEQGGEAAARLLSHARHHDLLVLARHRRPDGVAPDRLQTFLLQSGRPLILAPAKVTVPPLDHVVVCWKESADAARVLGAAMPLLAHANRVHLVAVTENGERSLMSGLEELALQLRWSGIAVDYAILSQPRGQSMADTLLHAAREREAGLIVMGAYGHSQARQFVFGGSTRRMLEDAAIDVAVFMAH